MATPTSEDYLKQIYLQQHERGDDALVLMGQLASAVGVTPGTATTMVKALARGGLAKYQPRVGVRLNKRGVTAARQVLRRHRLVELFLVQELGMDWAEVHDEAEVLEHAVSDKVLDRIDALMGFPDADPHGDPIPPAAISTDKRKSTYSAHNASDLTRCPIGQPLQIVRVIDQAPAFLRYVEAQGLMPGTTVTVATRHAEADAVTVRRDRRHTLTLGTGTVRKVLVAAT